MLLRGNSRHLRKKRLKLNLLKTEYLGVLSKLRPNIKPVRMLRQLMHRLRLINPTQLTPTTSSRTMLTPVIRQISRVTRQPMPHPSRLPTHRALLLQPTGINTPTQTPYIPPRAYLQLSYHQHSYSTPTGYPQGYTGTYTAPNETAPVQPYGQSQSTGSY